MKKTLLYRWFGIGSIPKKVRPVLQAEGVVVADEGMAGRFIANDVKGPGKRYRQRSEGFSGCLVITKKRVIAYTFGKRQLNIGVNDPKLPEIFADVPDAETLVISFESSVFREGWQGVMAFKFKTGKASQFMETLKDIGVRQGSRL